MSGCGNESKREWLSYMYWAKFRANLELWLTFRRVRKIIIRLYINLNPAALSQLLVLDVAQSLGLQMHIVDKLKAP